MNKSLVKITIIGLLVCGAIWFAYRQGVVRPTNQPICVVDIHQPTPSWALPGAKKVTWLEKGLPLDRVVDIFGAEDVCGCVKFIRDDVALLVWEEGDAVCESHERAHKRRGMLHCT